jgi:hypothetical protein
LWQVGARGSWQFVVRSDKYKKSTKLQWHIGRYQGEHASESGAFVFKWARGGYHRYEVMWIYSGFFELTGRKTPRILTNFQSVFQ